MSGMWVSVVSGMLGALAGIAFSIGRIVAAIVSESIALTPGLFGLLISIVAAAVSANVVRSERSAALTLAVCGALGMLALPDVYVLPAILMLIPGAWLPLRVWLRSVRRGRSGESDADRAPAESSAAARRFTPVARRAEDTLAADRRANAEHAHTADKHALPEAESPGLYSAHVTRAADATPAPLADFEVQRAHPEQVEATYSPVKVPDEQHVESEREIGYDIEGAPELEDDIEIAFDIDGDLDEQDYSLPHHLELVDDDALFNAAAPDSADSPASDSAEFEDRYNLLADDALFTPDVEEAFNFDRIADDDFYEVNYADVLMESASDSEGKPTADLHATSPVSISIDVLELAPTNVEPTEIVPVEGTSVEMAPAEAAPEPTPTGGGLKAPAAELVGDATGVQPSPAAAATSVPTSPAPSRAPHAKSAKSKSVTPDAKPASIQRAEAPAAELVSDATGVQPSLAAAATSVPTSPAPSPSPTSKYRPFDKTKRKSRSTH